MADTYFPLMADDRSDDLPRTLRRERDARQREAREREAKARSATLTHDFRASEPAFDSAPVVLSPATVMRFDVPFMHLMQFFLKAVVAAIPALILLGAILWGASALLKAARPDLMQASQQPHTALTCGAAATSAPQPLARMMPGARPLPAGAVKTGAVRKRSTAEKLKMSRN